MKMSWHRLGRTTEKAPVVIVALEIDEADFVAARLNGLSESGKLSVKLSTLMRMAKDQEAKESESFEDHLRRVTQGCHIPTVGSLHGLNEMRKLCNLPPIPDEEKDNANISQLQKLWKTL